MHLARKKIHFFIDFRVYMKTLGDGEWNLISAYALKFI